MGPADVKRSATEHRHLECLMRLSIEQLGHHDHACLVYADRQEPVSVVRPLIRIGLERGERCVCIVRPETLPELVDALNHDGIAVESAIAHGRLRLLPHNDARLQDVHKNLSQLGTCLAEEAASAPSQGLRFFAELTEATVTHPVVEEWRQYATLVDRLCRDHPLLVVCQIDQNRIPQSLLLDIVFSHPVVVSHGKISRNLSCEPADEIHEPQRVSHYVTRLLCSIHERYDAETFLQQRACDLNERLKELNCLYGISGLLERPDEPLNEVLQGVVRLIPPAYRFPEIACARIRVENQVYVTADFVETSWRQAADIVADSNPLGCVEVFYRTAAPIMDEGPFIREERALLNAVAERLGKVIVRKRAEARNAELQDQLRQAQKLEAVGTLAAGIAHDFGNLLTAISSYIEQTKATLPPGHASLQSLDTVENALSDARRVTNSLLTFTRKGTTRKSPVNLCTTVLDFLRMVRGMLPKSIEVRESIPAEGQVWVLADPTQLHQVLMNLITNARDAMPDGGNLTIAVSQGSPDANHESLKWAVLTVEDSGMGMTSKVVSRVFEPFFTTKPRGQGTGLGLPVTLAIVEDHGGKVSLKSSPGKGSRFDVLLPRCEPPVSAGGKLQPARDEKLGHGELILLVEDNVYIGTIIADTLREAGFEVRHLPDGGGTREALVDCSQRIRLAILDADSPTPDVSAILQSIRSVRRDLPAILTTKNPAFRPDGSLNPEPIVLRKPFGMSELIQTVCETIGRGMQGATRS